MADTLNAVPNATQIWPLQRDCVVFYGNPNASTFEAQHLVFVNPPFDMSYRDGQHESAVKKITINRACSASLARVLSAVWSGCAHSQAEIDRLGISDFSGSYNNRTIRGSHFLSMHAFGAAIDFCAGRNALTYDKTGGYFKPDHPLVKAFKAEGWIWGGDWQGRRDPMHFQAARVR